jgi:hypothetical protein
MLMCTHRRALFRVVVALALGAWLLVGVARSQAVAQPVPAQSVAAREDAAPLQQVCATSPDLRVQSMSLSSDPPLVGVSFDVVVEIVNDGGVASNMDTWTYLYVDQAPQGDPHVQRASQTGNLQPGQAITTYLTVPSSFATAGFHTAAVRLDATGILDETSGGACPGEDNNTGTIDFQIQNPPTPTVAVPTATPVPAPTIYFFEPANATVVAGESVTLKWQVYGFQATATLDSDPVPLEGSLEITPQQAEHVYTLRAENPGGFAVATSRVKVVQPTATPTLTATPCPLATIHQFGATRTSVYRGQETTLFWDLSGATEAYLNGQGVAGVSQKTVAVDQTTVFTLLAHNSCGDVEKSLTIDVRFATPSPTPRPTNTPFPTRTPTATRPPATPTRRVLPTPTPVPRTPTITPGVPAPLVSPLEPSPTPTLTATPTETVTPTETPTGTPTPVPTKRLEMVTATPTPTTPLVMQAVTPSPPPATATPVLTPTQSLGVGSVRMYVCPLGILILFSIGVLVLSLVLPRIRAREETSPLTETDTLFDPSELLPTEGFRVEENQRARSRSYDLDDLPAEEGEWMPVIEDEDRQS